MTISLGLLMLVIVGLAWKMKGAQLPHVFLGMMLVKAAAPGSIVDSVAAQGLTILTSVINSVSTALGKGNIAVVVSAVTAIPGALGKGAD